MAIPSTLTDRFGRTLTQDEAGRWICGGIVVGPCDALQALSTFNAMAPDGWIDPTTQLAAPE